MMHPESDAPVSSMVNINIVFFIISLRKMRRTEKPCADNISYKVLLRKATQYLHRLRAYPHGKSHRTIFLRFSGL